MKRYVTLALLFAATLLSACGFHLRGATLHDDLPFKTVYVITPDKSPFCVEFLRNLRSSTQTRVVDDPRDAQVIIEIMGEKKTRSILSLNIQGRAREYSLAYQITYRVRDNINYELQPPAKISVNRTMTFSEMHALARESEEELLYRDMQTDMIQQLLRRLAAIKYPPAGAPAQPGVSPKMPHANPS